MEPLSGVKVLACSERHVHFSAGILRPEARAYLAYLAVMAVSAECAAQHGAHAGSA